MAIAQQAAATVLRAPSPALRPTSDPLWYRRGLIYQLHVRGFYDTNADGIGDLPGVVRKLDYLQELGVTGLWLLPLFASPMRDGGYDISDYRAVHPDYGTLRDFKTLVAQAHRRDMRLIVELVLNHTSDQHAWFQRARQSPPGSVWRNFYHWSDTPRRFREARRVFPDAESSNWTWDPVAEAYYFHRFYHHEPDLNYDSREVQRAVIQVVDHWLGTGVDGLALNTIAYLYEREGTICENLPETHAFLRALREHIDAHFGDRVLVAAVNQWPEDAAAYFGNGQECHAALNFPLAPRLYMAVQAEDRRPIVEILEQTGGETAEGHWILFLRNQDELGLQMVTEQERNALLRSYAQDPQFRVHMGIRRRLAPLMENNRAKIELLNGLLFSLPGTPTIYYGDEIGMGDNPYLGDRAGVRTPMQWSPDRNAGFSEANRQQLFLPVIVDPGYHYETINVRTEAQNPHSLLSWMRRLAARRQLSPALSEGSLEFVDPHNPKLLALVRRHEEQTVLVVANLSRFAQVAQLDLSDYREFVPVELFGRVAFPPVGNAPYFLTLAPYGLFWLELQSPEESAGLEVTGHSLKTGPLPAVIELDGPWTDLFREPTRHTLGRLLPGFLTSRRWFGGKARTIRSAEVLEAVPMPLPGGLAMWVIAGVEYAEAQRERYVLPLGVATEDRLRWNDGLPAESIVARLRSLEDGERRETVLYDLFSDESFADALLEAIAQHKNFPGGGGRIRASATRVFQRLRGPDSGRLASRVLRGETSNSTLLYDERFLLKLVRRLEEGVNPDLEIGRFLTDEVGFGNAPPVGGALEYLEPDAEPMTLAILFGFVPNQGNAWEYTLQALGGFFERLLTGNGVPRLDDTAFPPLRIAGLEEQAGPSASIAGRLGDYLQAAELLGRRTAQMHLALATDRGNPQFTPEPFSLLYQRSLYQSLRSQAQAAVELLEQPRAAVQPETRDSADQVLSHADELIDRFKLLVGRPIDATRTRCHGDYHLGQVLYTGNDFVIIDFEGEPARPISERRLKASPLRDVAGMLRSFDYACHAAAREHLAGADLGDDDRRRLDPWVRSWVAWTSHAYLRSYLTVARGASFLPRDASHADLLLDAYLAEKALYELQYELNNRPDWLHIPLAGLLSLLTTDH
jgi:maltose alpha-D-glucosyltransferase/alpha-amylase